MSAAPAAGKLRVVQVWHGEPHEERSFTWAPETWCAVGGGEHCHFSIPEALGTHRLFRAVAGGFAISVEPGMGGTLNLGGRRFAAADAPGDHALAPGDWGIVSLDDAREHAFYFEALRGVPPLYARFDVDGFLLAALLFALFIHAGVLGVSWFAAEPVSDDELATQPERVARLILDKDWPAKPTPDEKGQKSKKEGARKAREEDVSKRAAGKEGKFGDPKSAHKDSVVPKGPRDQIAARVQNVGVLGALKAQKGDSSLARLLSSGDKNADMTTALAGLEGAKLQIGQGSGGMSTRGTGGGGGGTGKGQLFGTGDLQVGGGGNARSPHPGGGPVGGHGPKEKTVEIGGGGGTTDGSLSKEQIYKVVASHAAAIQFCFEKELQRFPHLQGKVVLGWRVELDGRVSNARVDSSSLNNAGTEGCMVRQLKMWVFPKPQGTVAQVSFPFVFRGH